MAMVMTMAGCATRSTGQPSDIDPLESSNRAIYNFNDTIDRAILTPVAEAYRFITPQPVRTCINNIFLNLGDVWSGLNSFMQGRQEDALNTSRLPVPYVITVDSVNQKVPMEGQPAYQSLFIVQPLSARSGLGLLFSTHPPIEKRIAALEREAEQMGVFVRR